MLGSVILLWISFSLLFLIFRTKRPRNFPPGPRPIPILGNLLQLNLLDPLNGLKKVGESGELTSCSHIWLNSENITITLAYDYMR